MKKKSIKELTRGCLDSILGTPLALFIKVLIRMRALPSVRRQFGMFCVTLNQAAHSNYTEQIKNRYDIHPSVYWGEETLIYGEGEIFIGEGSYIGRNSYILSHPGKTCLHIGRFCAISHSVHIRTEVNKRKISFADDLESPPLGKNVHIGDHVWIGAHVFIGGGITIGENSIIGANSVVTKDVPANSIVAGVPAKLIGLKSDYA